MADMDDEMQDTNEIMNDEMHNDENEEGDNEDNSFFSRDEDNSKAVNRERGIDTEALSINPELLSDLRGLKQALYNSVVFGPPVGSEEAQDPKLLQVYESLLIELNNLLGSIFEDDNQTREFAAQQFARFPEPMREPVRAYCVKIMQFKTSNTKPYLNDILTDHFDRILKEHPY